jgi:hypothetical protein
VDDLPAGITLDGRRFQVRAGPNEIIETDFDDGDGDGDGDRSGRDGCSHPVGRGIEEGERRAGHCRGGRGQAEFEFQVELFGRPCTGVVALERRFQ